MAIRELEHQADDEARRLYVQLRRDFLPPFGAASARRLTVALDDVVDAIEEVAARANIYDIRAIPEAARDLGRVLGEACRETLGAVVALRRLHEPEAALAACRAVGLQEREADRLLRLFLARLLAEDRDVLMVIKWSELGGLIEAATDRCDDVANTIEGIVIAEA